MGDSYRPSYPSYGAAPQYQYGYRGAPAVSPYPPLPPEPPPPGLPPMYNFGQGSNEGHFNFQANSLAPSYPMNYGPPPPPPPRADHYHPGHQYGRRDRPFRRDRPRIPTADRPLLRFQRDNTPNQLMGMDGEADNVQQRFRDVRDMSDSEEEIMMESDTESNHAETTNLAEGALREEAQVPAKWSNPEPYTALPPTQDMSRKKRDVVKMIRKARLAAKEIDPLKQVAQNDDFISLDFGDEEGSKADNDEAELRKPPANAPSGPRSSVQPSNRNQVERLIPATNNSQVIAGSTAEHPTLSTNVPQSQPSSIAERLQESRKRKRSPEPSEDGSIDEDGDIEGPAAKYARSVKIKSNGDVQAKWKARNGSNPIPWVKEGEHDFTEAPGFRLHKEICDFYEFVRPQPFEQRVRQDLLKRVHNTIKRFDQDYDVQCFGSFAAGIYLPDADMDLVVVSQTFLRSLKPNIAGPAQLRKIAAWLVREGFTDPAGIEVLAQTKVPLVKFVDKLTGIRVDMSFENITGIVANTTFGTWKAQHPAMPVLVTIIKQFLLMRRLNEVISGGIGGFAITCLVTSLLQNMPRALTGQFRPEEHLGEVLIEFLDFYGNQFDLGTTAIQMNPPCLIHKSIVDPAKWMAGRQNRLHIVDPNNPANDISGGSNNVELVFEKFAYARAELLATMQSLSAKSYLQSLIGGDYSHYVEPRERLRKLSRRLIEPSLEEGSLLPALTEPSLTGKLGEFLKANEEEQASRRRHRNEMKAKNKKAREEKKRKAKTKKTMGEMKPQSKQEGTQAKKKDPHNKQEGSQAKKKSPHSMPEGLQSTQKSPQSKREGPRSKQEDLSHTPRSAARAVAFRRNFPYFTDVDVPGGLSRSEYNKLAKMANNGPVTQREDGNPGAKNAKKADSAEAMKGYSESLGKEFPEFRHLIPRTMGKEMQGLFVRALQVKRSNPDLDLPTKLTKETVGQLVARAQKGQQGNNVQNPAKRRKKSEDASTESHSINTMVDMTGSAPAGRLQDQVIGSNDQSSASALKSQGRAADDPIVIG